MTDSDNRTQRINAQVIGFPSPGQARLLIAPGNGVLDGGVPVDIPIELISADLRVDRQMVIAVYEQDSLEILAVEPDTGDVPLIVRIGVGLLESYATTIPC
ncbi:MAG TPA: hypothetical protein VMY37_40250 [Thermoguttaceae bacterium]|nr:hypothetical protein [Thermoguttaceae bacterium]